MTSKNVPMTKEGAQALRDELRQLIDIERPMIAQAISDARELGDLKENAEYHAAKDQQGHIEARISFIQNQIQHAQIIDITSFTNHDKVLFGSTITLLNLDNDQIMKIQLVGEHEADIKSGKMSITAPIARACIGKEMGDVAEVETPNGMAEYSIEKIEYI
tara:strand:- start:1278 stop:1760 length:483 start_codon:yes stop_codon:yes gene_type:complete